MDLLSDVPHGFHDSYWDHLPPEQRRDALVQLEILLLQNMLSYATIDEPSLDHEQASRFLKSDLTDQTLRESAILWLKENVRDFKGALMFQYRMIQAHLPAQEAAGPSDSAVSRGVTKPIVQELPNHRTRKAGLFWLIIALSVLTLVVSSLAYLYLHGS